MSERYGCRHCNFRGYVKHSFGFGGEDGDVESVSVSVCSHCKDARGYYAYIKEKYGNSKNNNVVSIHDSNQSDKMAKVLDFVSFRDRKYSGNSNDECD